MTDVPDHTLRRGILGGMGLVAPFAVGVLILGYGIWKWDSGQAVKQTEDQLVRDIDAQLPMGTPHAEIAKFVIAHGLAAPFYYNYGGSTPAMEGATAVLVTQTTPLDPAGLPVRRLGHTDGVFARDSVQIHPGNREPG
jgi:hypothetical protein